jgi:hypothetical protein
LKSVLQGKIEWKERSRWWRWHVGPSVKWSFYPFSQLKMPSLFGVVCCRPNYTFEVCCKLNSLWRCALHKTKF